MGDADRVFRSIADPELTNRNGSTGSAHEDLGPGSVHRVAGNEEFKAATAADGFPYPDVVVNGEAVEADPPRQLVTTVDVLG